MQQLCYKSKMRVDTPTSFSSKLLWALVLLALMSLLLIAVASAHKSLKFPATQVAAGKKIFASSGCGKCHVLAAAKSHGAVGPNLDKIHPPYSLIVSQVTNGGRFMPPFAASVGGALSPTQVKNVAALVYTSEHR